MTKQEKELLWSYVEDVEKSDDKIDQLESLYFAIRRMIGFK